MAAIWKINGDTFASLGLSGLRRELRTLAPDIVTFVAAGAAYDSADLSGLEIGAVVSITREVDAVETQWFKGVVTQIPREGAPEGEALTYEVTGPWYYLEQLVYQQRFPLNATANPTVTSPELSRRAFSMIGQDYLGQRETNIAALTDVLDWCIGAGAGFSRGSLPTGFNFPYVSMIAPTCVEAARACLKWMPDAASRFDYSAATPVLSVVRRGSASATTVDLSAPPATITDLSVTPRPDLKVDHVVIQRVSIDPTSYWIVSEEKDPIGSTGLEFGSLVIPLDNNTDPLPAGLAANWRSSLSTLQYQGRLRFVAEDCGFTVRPGDVLNLTNGVTAWATMNAQITAVNEDVDAGTTEWIFGPPAHLSIQDFITLLRAARQQVTPYNGPPLVAGRRDPGASGEEDAASSLIPTGQTIDGDLSVGGLLNAGGWEVGDALTDLDAAVNILESDVAGHTTAISTLESDMVLVDADLSNHEARISSLENDVATHDELFVEVYSNVDILDAARTDHEARLAELEFYDLAAISDQIAALETAVETHDGLFLEVYSNVDILDAARTDHETRIANLETAVDGVAAAIAAAVAGIPTTSLETCDGFVDVLVPA